MIQMYGRSSVLLWHCLEGTVLGFHCKAPYFPIESQQLRKTLLVCSPLSIRNQTTNYKTPSFGSRSKNDIFNSHISSRRSENKYFKTWLRLAIGSWHSHGLFECLAEGLQRTSSCVGISHLGERLKMETGPRLPWKTSITGYTLK